MRYDRPMNKIALLLALACAVGCKGVGTKRVLFYTRSNVGVDISGVPPTFDVTIARKEGVMEPVFEGGQTLPVIASFRSDVGFAPLRLFTGIAMTFATSEAALVLASYQGQGDKVDEVVKSKLARQDPAAAAGDRKERGGRGGVR